MALSSLDHCAIRTAKLAETRAFYVDVLGLRDGDRPDFPFPGNWLYVEGVAVVHLVGIDPDDPSGLEDYLGPIALDELQGSGAVDHIAFRAGDATGLMAGCARWTSSSASATSPAWTCSSSSSKIRTGSRSSSTTSAKTGNRGRTCRWQRPRAQSRAARR